MLGAHAQILFTALATSKRPYLETSGERRRTGCKKVEIDVGRPVWNRRFRTVAGYSRLGWDGHEEPQSRGIVASPPIGRLMSRAAYLSTTNKGGRI